MEQYSIILTGPYSSGRLTFLQHVGDFPITQTDHGDDFSVFHSTVRIPIDDDLELQIFRVSGSERYTSFWSNGGSPSLIGIIELVDSSQPAIFREAISILDTFRAYLNVPPLVAANKQDLPEAWSIDDLRIALHVPDWMPVVPCVATDHASVRQVLLTLLEYVRANLEEPMLE